MDDPRRIMSRGGCEDGRRTPASWQNVSHGCGCDDLKPTDEKREKCRFWAWQVVTEITLSLLDLNIDSV